MISLLRFISFIFGFLLILAPSFLLLQFAYGVGEPPSPADVFLFAPTVVVGLVLGGGLLLVGLPGLVKGTSKSIPRFLAGSLIILSFLSIMIFGFSGSVTRIVSPTILFVELSIFYVFIYPAKSFSRKVANG